MGGRLFTKKVVDVGQGLGGGFCGNAGGKEGLECFGEDFSRGCAEIGCDMPFGGECEDGSCDFVAVLYCYRADDLLYFGNHGMGD